MLVMIVSLCPAHQSLETVQKILWITLLGRFLFVYDYYNYIDWSEFGCKEKDAQNYKEADYARDSRDATRDWGFTAGEVHRGNFTMSYLFLPCFIVKSRRTPTRLKDRNLENENLPNFSSIINEFLRLFWNYFEKFHSCVGVLLHHYKFPERKSHQNE